MTPVLLSSVVHSRVRSPIPYLRDPKTTCRCLRRRGRTPTPGASIRPSTDGARPHRRMRRPRSIRRIADSRGSGPTVQLAIRMYAQDATDATQVTMVTSYAERSRAGAARAEVASRRPARSPSGPRQQAVGVASFVHASRRFSNFVRTVTRQPDFFVLPVQDNLARAGATDRPDPAYAPARLQFSA